MELVIFYILAVVTVITTIFAVTERHTVHAIVYLVTSFFALAVLFYLLGAPVVALFEVIIYAGAIMVLFLFVIMMLDLGPPEEMKGLKLSDYLPALVLTAMIFAALIALIMCRSGLSPVGGGTGVREFSLVMFQKYGIAVEIISMQLLFALVGAFYLGKRK